MAQGRSFGIVLAKLRGRWKWLIVLLIGMILLFGPRLFANPETVFAKTFNADLPKDGKGHLIEFESGSHSRFFVFEGDYEFLRALERQVLPRWEQIEGCKPDDIFKVPGLIRKHKLFQESANRLQWVYVGQTSGRMEGDVIVFCTDLDHWAWVMSARMESGLSPMLSVLNKVFWLALGIYFLCRYWSPKQQTNVSQSANEG